MTVHSIEQALKERHIQVRNRLWPVRRKPVQPPPPPAAITMDTREARRLREEKLAEQRLLQYRINQRRLEERAQKAKEERKEQQRRNAEARRQAKKDRAYRPANTGPDWAEIGPTLVNGSMESIRDQVLAFFPHFTFGDILAVNRDPARGKVLRLIVTAIRDFNPDISLEEIGAFLQRDRSTLTWHLRRSHLRGTIKPRRFIRSDLDRRIEDVQALFDAGRTLEQMADDLGICATSVGKFVRRHGWTRAKAHRRKG